MTAYLGECEWFCERCAPNDAKEYDVGEADAPVHCATCHEPLDYSLTPDGVAYVIEALQEQIDNWNDSPSIAMARWKEKHDCYKGSWYENSPWITITRDWAEKLKWYGLDSDDEYTVDMFLTVTLCAVKD